MIDLAMTETGPKTVSDLIRLVQDGEEREFKRVADPTGTEPAFYRMTTAGEYPDSPRWENPISINERPKPTVNDWPHVPLAAAGKFQFDSDADRDGLADLYKVTTGLYLVSGRLVDFLNEWDPSAVESAPASLRLRAGDVIEDYKVVMPSRVVDAVDINKTDVTITRTEAPKGSGRYVTHVRHDHGAVMRDDLAKVPTFLRKYQADWYWREDVVRAAVKMRLRGLRAVFCSDTATRPEIRT